MSGPRTVPAYLLSVLIAMSCVASAVAQARAAAVGGSTGRSAAAAPKITLVVGRVLSAPHVVTGADRRLHLAHEVLLTNTAFFPIALKRLDTVDPATGAILESLRGANLAARVKRPEGGSFDGTLGAGLSGVVIIDATLSRRAPLPHALSHRISLQFTSPPGFPTLAKHYRLARTIVRQDRPIVIGRPLRGSGWVAVNGCCNALNAHRGGILPVNGRLVAAERFAIDFVQLDRHRRMFTGPVRRLAGYAAYGERVLSVAAGTVIAISDTAPDQLPPNLPPFDLATAAGNNVVIDLGGHRFAFYAHLRPRSIRVHVGETVRRGQVLGLLGNSGNSTAPHLHFQISDGPTMATANSLPYEIAHFSSAGTVTDEQALDSGRVTPVSRRLAGAHNDQLPLNLEVVTLHQ
jgi:hypothetical protein